MIKDRRYYRHKKIRSRMSGTAERPRVHVDRSNKKLYVQVIDDVAQKTLFGKVGADSAELGKALAEEVLKQNIKDIVFDRGGYRYHGRVKALAEAMREGGLNF